MKQIQRNASRFTNHLRASHNLWVLARLPWLLSGAPAQKRPA